MMIMIMAMTVRVMGELEGVGLRAEWNRTGGSYSGSSVYGPRYDGYLASPDVLQSYWRPPAKLILV